MSQHNSMALLLNQLMSGKTEGAPASMDGVNDVAANAGSFENALESMRAMLTI